MILRIILFLCGVVLLLPGLCTLGFGVYFVGSSPSGILMWIWWFILGGAATWAAVALLAMAFKRDL